MDGRRLGLRAVWRLACNTLLLSIFPVPASVLSCPRIVPSCVPSARPAASVHHHDLSIPPRARARLLRSSAAPRPALHYYRLLYIVLGNVFLRLSRQHHGTTRRSFPAVAPLAPCANPLEQQTPTTPALPFYRSMTPATSPSYPFSLSLSPLWLCSCLVVSGSL